MLKLVGAIMVIGGFFYIGMCMSRSLKRRMQALKEMIDLLYIIKSEITCNLTSLPEIINVLNCKSENIKSMRGLLEYLGNKIGNSNEFEETFSEIWRDGLSFVDGLKSDDVYELIGLGDILGQFDSELQGSKIDFVTESLDNRLKKAEIEYEKKGRLYRAFGIGGGIVMVLAVI